MKQYSLLGVDGNAFAVIGYVVNAMHECGKSKKETELYFAAAKNSDYNHLLSVSADMIRLLNHEQLKQNEKCENN